MRIISASRRTDIPAFYSEWFMRRVEEGWVRWRNPFGGRETVTSLRPEDVAAFVFWSKDYAPMLPHLGTLWERGYRFIFHFTITGLPRVFEPRVPPAEVTIPVARELAGRFGPDAVLWRYDPILVSSITDVDYHRGRFAEIASALNGATRRCYFSFPTLYGKTIRATARLERETGIRLVNLPVDDRVALAEDLAEIAASHGITMHTCCGDYLISDCVHKARCVDAELIFRLYPDRMTRTLRRGTRKQCGCYESTDIGAYDTCPHGCVYCYANANKEAAQARWNRHEPYRESL